jgi:hypothetical protein
MKTLNLLLLIYFTLNAPIFAQTPDLGSSSSFAVFTAIGAFNNVGAATNVVGDVGTNVGAFNAFPPGVLVGDIHVADPVSVQAAIDVDLAYAFTAALTCGQVLTSTLGNGQVLTPNIYCIGEAATINETLFLDGECNPDAIFIFQINGALSTSTFANIILTNSASICNVYWQVNGAVSIAEDAIFRGNILANGAINLLEAAELYGRALSRDGAVSLANNFIRIDQSPTPSIIISNGPTTFCQNGSVILSGNCGGTWSNGSIDPSITVTQSGTYTVTNTNDCGNATSNVITVTVNPLPNCIITGDIVICDGQSTELCAIGGTNYIWSTGATTDCITATTIGTYSVTITDLNNCTSSCSVEVTTTSPTACSISGDNTICQGETTTLCATPGATGYLWTNGASTDCITVNTAGTYNVTITDGTGCTSSCSVTVSVSPIPNCSIIGDNTICQGESTTLCATPGATGYLWSNGASTDCITVNSAGTYIVTITDGTGCTSSCSITVSVSPTPTCNITGNNTICQGETTTLCATPGAIGYLWSNGASTDCITVNTAGTYNVTITDGTGCTSSCSVTVTVSPFPTCNITGDNTICQGESTTLCASPGATGYLWSNGASTDCITVNTAGTYIVTITDGNGCTSSCSVTVSVSPIPNCSITGDNTICQGETTTLCASPGATSYLWNNGASTDCITVNSAGTYNVTITDGTGCMSSCSVTVSVSLIPNCSITGDNTICQSETTTLCATPGATGYLWSNGASTDCITVNTAGTYIVTITDGTGCTSSCSVTVSVSPIPNCSITGDNTICQGETTTLCATPGSTGYLWSNGAITDCITVNIAGTYIVTITDGNGCTSSCSVTVSVSPTPNCSITGDNIICQGETTILCATPGATGYLWSNGASTDCITVNTAGTYNVTITDGTGCTSSCSVTVSLSPIPNCSITGDNIICQGETTTLCATPGATSYLWSNGASSNCILVNTPGLYSVTIMNINGCVSICSQTVTVRDLPICEITGEDAFCESSETEICANQGNFSYIWSTGETTSCILVSQAGSYQVTITDVYGCSSICQKSLTTKPLPICEISGLEFLCEGSTNELCVPPGYEDYWWEDGQQTNCIDGSIPGNYAITITNNEGCKSFCNIEVSIIPSSENCVITGETVLCGNNDLVIICAIPNQESYLWSNGETTQCIAVSEAGEYAVTVSQNQACITYCNVHVTSQQNVIPPVIFAVGSTSLCQGDSVTLYGNVPGVWNNGETSPSITTSIAGSYFLITENPCGADYQSNIITISTIDNPGTSSIFSLTPTTFCEGDSVILYGNVQGIWNTGDTSASISVTTSGSYFVTNSTSCDTVVSNVIIVNVIPLPNTSSIVAMSPTTFCEGQSIVLSGNINGTWNTGETTPSIEVSTSGDYYVINANVCDTTLSNSISVQVNPMPVASAVFTLDPTSFCQGNSVVLHGNTNGVWNTGDTTASITVDNPGNYFVTNTNQCGNVVSNAIPVQVTEVPQCHIAGNLNPTLGETVILCAPKGVDAYKWNTLDKTRCITITESGMRNVTVTNNNLCMDSCSVQVIFSEVSSTGDQDKGPLKFKIYPNPFFDETTIEFKHELAGQQIKVDLINAVGEQVKSIHFENTASEQWHKINLQGHDLSAGVYMLKLTSGKTVIFKKLILIK